MSQADLAKLTVADLVRRYANLGVEDDKACMQFDAEWSTRVRRRMWAIEDELKSRPGDQRRALLALYDHPNMGLRLMAAKATLAVAPQQARKMIEWIASLNWPAHSGDAGMCLWALDKGIGVPK
jgi:cytochrome c oxidase assembly protein Cox11